MAVREHWEIKWIKWINVQEDWVTKVSIADTVNFVGWWTVTDVWWVATINIPEWVTWYREDVTAGSATYTFVNAPATSTSFLVFTDSGTLLFSGIDYTYDPDTETITFLSLGANEKAYIWVAHALNQWWWIGDMVKAVYDPNNVQRNVYDYNNFINTPTINTKLFTLSSTSDLTNAQAAYDWYRTWNAPVVRYDWGDYLVEFADSSKVILCSTGYHKETETSYNGRTQNNLIFSLSSNSVTSVTTSYGGNLTMYYLSPVVDYATPYQPQYPGSPATKKYVDDNVADKVEWPISSTDWNIVVFDWATGKVVKDSWLKIMLSNNPTWSLCDVYYDNGTIYLEVKQVSNVLLENWDIVLLENSDKLSLES